MINEHDAATPWYRHSGLQERAIRPWPQVSQVHVLMARWVFTSWSNKEVVECNYSSTCVTQLASWLWGIYLGGAFLRHALATACNFD
jgi:hypothetical protein